METTGHLPNEFMQMNDKTGSSIVIKTLLRALHDWKLWRAMIVRVMKGHGIKNKKI